MKITNPTDVVELLGMFRIALINNLIDKKEIIKWADSIVLNEDEPNAFFIELSLLGSKSVNDIISFFSEFLGEFHPKTSVHAALGVIYSKFKSGDLSLEKVIYCVDWVCWNTDISEGEKYFMYELEGHYCSVTKYKCGSIEALENNTVQILEVYRYFKIDNYKDWHNLSATIGSKIAMLESHNDEKQAVTLATQENAMLKSQNDEKQVTTIAAQEKKKWWKLW